MSSPDPEIFFKTQQNESLENHPDLEMNMLNQNRSRSDRSMSASSSTQDKRVVTFRSPERAHTGTSADLLVHPVDLDQDHTNNIDLYVDQPDASTIDPLHQVPVDLQRPHTDSVTPRSHPDNLDPHVDLQRSHTRISCPRPHRDSLDVQHARQRPHTDIFTPRSHPDNLDPYFDLQRSHTDNPQNIQQKRLHTSLMGPKSRNLLDPLPEQQIPHIRNSTPCLRPDRTNNNNLHRDLETANNRPPFAGDFAFRNPPHLPTHVMKPDTYDGSQNFEQYVSHFEDCSELSGWDNRTKVLILATSLRGSARTYYMSLSDHERRDYFLLTARMTDRFGNSRHQSLWLSKLENRRRNKGESIASLGDDLRQLAQKAYFDLDSRAQEQLALNQFYKLISVEMKCRCIDHSCATVNEAVTVVERYESILGAPNLTNIRVLDTKPDSATSNVSDLAAAMKRIENRLDKMEKSHPHNPTAMTGSNNRLCYGCNSPKHFWRECPHNTEQPQLRPNRQPLLPTPYSSRVTQGRDQRYGYNQPQAPRRPYTPAHNVRNMSEN